MLQIDDLTFNAWGRRFFDHATVTVPPNAKVGLVGRNGVGKSTLFKLILGELMPDGGQIGLPRLARVASVEQEHPATPVSLLETILAADEQRDALHAELESAEPEQIADIYARLSEIDADRAPARASEILAGLGFSTTDLARPMAEFSGGWRMRVALAAVLFAEPDLLLLDEPTNYLDLEGALWLEARLRKYPNAAIIISHDRELLNSSVEAILHLHAGKLDLYTESSICTPVDTKISSVGVARRRACYRRRVRSRRQSARICKVLSTVSAPRPVRRHRRSRASNAWPGWSRLPRPLKSESPHSRCRHPGDR